MIHLRGHSIEYMKTDLIGHAEQYAYLSRQHEQQALDHAYLFVGPKASGGKTLMKAFLSLLCPVEMIELTPLEDEQGGARAISLKQIQSLRAALSRTAFSGGIRAVFLPDASTLNNASSNALLKILEEPPESVVFLLRAAALTSVVPTIASRCSIIRLSPPYGQAYRIHKLSLGRIGAAMRYVKNSVDLEKAIARYEERRSFEAMPLSQRLMSGISLSPESVDEWLLEIERDLLEKRTFSCSTVDKYGALIQYLRSANGSLREESRFNAFCLAL